MNKNAYIIFVLENQYYGLSVNTIKNVIRAVALTNLAEGPDLVAGLLNIGGEFIPVVNIREQLSLPQKKIQISDRIIIAQVFEYTIAFIADAIEDVVELEQVPIDDSADIFPGMEKFLKGISRFNDETVLIYDISTLFPEKEIRHINDVLQEIEEPA